LLARRRYVSDPDGRGTAFIRLHSLVDYGWLPRLGNTSAADAIWLTHPDVLEPVILYSDGRVIGDRDRIRVETDVEFDGLLRRTGRPNALRRYWHRNRDVVYGLMFWPVMLALGYVLLEAARIVRRALGP
jgi:hypothetical protein